MILRPAALGGPSRGRRGGRVDTHAHRAGDARPDVTVIGPGLCLDDRYRLDQVRTEHRTGDLQVVLWRATDLALDRWVAVTIVTGAADERRSALLDAATSAS